MLILKSKNCWQIEMLYLEIIILFAYLYQLFTNLGKLYKLLMNYINIFHCAQLLHIKPMTSTHAVQFRQLEKQIYYVHLMSRQSLQLPYPITRRFSLQSVAH